MTGNDFFALVTDCLITPSRKDKIEILKYLYGFKDTEVKNRYDAEKLTGSLFRISADEIKQAADEAEKTLDLCMKRGVRLVSFFNPEYPPLLREIYSPPSVLFVKGNLPDMERPSLAVVGTRNASRKTLEAAYESAYSAAENSVSVISGLASGIDSAAHRGALDSRGYTAAVLGSGADIIYPAANRKLAERILSTGGSLISEYRPGTGPLRYHFPERNRIISGISRGTLVVHAPEKSGSLITASFALDQGRDVFVHEAGICSDSGKGGFLLRENGAFSVKSGSDILTEWNIEENRSRKEYRIDNDTVFTVKENNFTGMENKPGSQQSLYSNDSCCAGGSERNGLNGGSNGLRLNVPERMVENIKQAAGSQIRTANKGLYNRRKLYA